MDLSNMPWWTSLKWTGVSQSASQSIVGETIVYKEAADDMEVPALDSSLGLGSSGMQNAVQQNVEGATNAAANLLRAWPTITVASNGIQYYYVGPDRIYIDTSGVYSMTTTDTTTEEEVKSKRNRMIEL